MDPPEFYFYVTLKLHVYETLTSNPRTRDRPEGAKPRDSALTGITARKVHKLKHGRTGKSPTDAVFTDLRECSSYLIRNHLHNLNHGTILKDDGRGFRNSQAYRWVQPVTSSDVHAFRRLATILRGNVHLAPDVHRLAEAFLDSPFAVQDFLGVVQETMPRPGRSRKPRKTPADPAQTRFVAQRLDNLETHGILDRVGDRYRLSATGREAAQWFQLFAYSARFRTPAQGPDAGDANRRRQRDK